MASPQKPKDDRQKARLAKLDEKWKILFNQTTRAPIYSVQQYVEYLSCYAKGKQELYVSSVSGNINVSTDSGIQAISYLLQKLKLDLKLSFSWFLEDFVRTPNDGLSLLLAILKNIQKAAKDVVSAPSKVKVQHKKRLVSDEHECLLCLKYCLRLHDAGRILLEASNGLENIASTLMSSNTKSRIIALEIMSLVLREPDGFNRNLECFTYFRLKNCEPVRFKFLVSMLTTRNSQSLAFQICCMKFLNSMLTASPTSNMKVFLQCELEMAGVDSNVLLLMAEDSNLPDKEDLVKEILDFKNNHTDVDLLIDDHRILTKQITTMKTQMKEQMDKSKSPKKRPAPPPPAAIEQTELDTPEVGPQTSSNVTKINIVDDHICQVPEDTAEIQTEKPKSRVADRVKELEQFGMKKVNHIDKDGQQVITKATKAKVAPCRNMPFLNWKPLEDVENTIFNTFNYESVLDKIELFDLEETFKIRNDMPSSKWTAKQNAPRRPPKIRFMDTSRAKNLVILQKRIGRCATDIKQYILDYDVDALLPDNAELLLKFIPTEEEMRTIMTLDFQFEDLDDAEKLLVQLMSIERLEERLKIMIFMDNFGETVVKLKEPIEEIRRASDSMLNCLKLRKVFEIILAVGNFLNGNRGGQVAGFRVSSLPLLGNIRSADRDKSLLDYVAEIVVNYYFDVHDWYDDMDTQQACQASYQAVSSSVKDLSTGMRILENEIQQSPSCQCLHRFHSESAEKYADVKQQFIKMEEAYVSVCALFGEAYQTIDSSEFFKTVHQFAENYRKTDKLLSRSRWRKGLSVVPVTRPTETMKQEQNLQYHPDMIHIENSDTSESTLQNNSGSNSQPYQRGRNSYDLYDKMVPHKTLSDLTAFQQYEVNSMESEDDQLVENWIVTSPPPEICSDVLHEESIEKKNRSRKKFSECEDDSIFDYDTESEDSAFVGSEGQYLRSSGSKSHERTVNVEDNAHFKTSTPRLPEENDNEQEPPPDYSFCDSPTGTLTKKGELDDEITKILNEFEGNLNGFCSRATTPSPRRFFTVRSIIYL